jgi:hypothetical protein
MRDEFRKKCLPKWESLIKSIFNGNVPEHYEWTDMHDVISILSTIGNSEALNHTFFASGGGLDLTDAIQSHESGCIELNFDGFAVCQDSCRIFLKKLFNKILPHLFHDSLYNEPLMVC